MILTALETRIAKIEADIAKETAGIHAPTAPHPSGGGYWHPRHKPRTALALRDATNEVQA